jgi:hypothetical protein
MVMDYRSRLALEQFQAEERRRQALAEQSSSLNAPDVRIRAWEKAHGLRLPDDPSHPVLRVVAQATRLALDQVLEEQQQRAARAQRTGRASKPEPVAAPVENVATLSFPPAPPAVIPE